MHTCSGTRATPAQPGNPEEQLPQEHVCEGWDSHHGYSGKGGQSLGNQGPGDAALRPALPSRQVRRDVQVCSQLHKDVICKGQGYSKLACMPPVYLLLTPLLNSLALAVTLGSK